MWTKFLSCVEVPRCVQPGCRWWWYRRGERRESSLPQEEQENGGGKGREKNATPRRRVRIGRDRHGPVRMMSRKRWRRASRKSTVTNRPLWQSIDAFSVLLLRQWSASTFSTRAAFFFLWSLNCPLLFFPSGGGKGNFERFRVCFLLFEF